MLRLPNGYFLSGFPTESCFAFLISLMCVSLHVMSTALFYCPDNIW